MPNYAARIELNGPPKSEIYEKLHDAMHNAGYERWILSSKGGYWQLPDAMYVGNSSRQQVSDEVKAIKKVVGAVWSSFEIIIFKYDGSSWDGLTRLTNDTK